MPFRYRARQILLVPAIMLTFSALAACSSSASSSSSPVAGTTASAASAPPAPSVSGGSTTAVAQIQANWIKFFSSATPNRDRIALLQNGQAFSSAIGNFSSNPLASAVKAKVDSVTLTSATRAAVQYDLTAAGISVAKGQTGTAVLENGVWKVGDDIFCGLLKKGAKLLGITVPAACK